MYSDIEELYQWYQIERVLDGACALIFISAIVLLLVSLLMGLCKSETCDDEIETKLWKWIEICIPTGLTGIGVAVVCGVLACFFPDRKDMDAAIRVRTAEILKDSPSATFIVDGEIKGAGDRK